MVGYTHHASIDTHAENESEKERETQRLLERDREEDQSITWQKVVARVWWIKKKCRMSADIVLESSLFVRLSQREGKMRNKINIGLVMVSFWPAKI